MGWKKEEEEGRRRRGKETERKRERERERTRCRKLEGRRSRPGLVLGLADSLALSRRNASNAGEPLLYLSFFNARSPSSVRLRPLPFSFPRLSFAVFILLLLLFLSSPSAPLSLFHQPPFHSVHSLLRRSNDTRDCSLPRIPLNLSFPSLSLSLSSSISSVH